MLVPVQDVVLDWFAAQGRDLPWRAPDVTPWGVFVSEFMLQQTPAARVIEPFERWLTRWPTPTALAESPAGDAVREWRNLGYPRRALWLHRAAVTMTTTFDGQVPSRVDDLLSLTGVGPYTARAVAVFAYRAHEPVVDTNIRRVIARWRHGQSNQGPASTARDLADMAALLPDPAHSPEFNAAVMELGAVVCTAKNPDCDNCPIASSCAWLIAGKPESVGAGKPKQKRYEGSDRQARGAILKVLREAQHPVGSAVIEKSWPDAAQRGRALDSLLRDGLIVLDTEDLFALPQ